MMDLTQQRYKVTEFNESLQAAVRRLFSENPTDGAKVADHLAEGLRLSDWDQPALALLETAKKLDLLLDGLYQDRGTDPFFGSD